MRKFWQTNWFDIEFSSFTEISSRQQAGEVFYSKFYDRFFKKFKSYEQLPLKWKEDKKMIADFIYDLIKYKANVLSIGCGSGFIENELSKMEWDGKLLAIEPSLSVSAWLKNNKKINLLNGYFPNILTSQHKFDFAYMSYVDYIFDDKLYMQMLNNIKEYPVSEFLLVGATIYMPDFKSNIKYHIKNILAKFGFLRQQLWGYERTIEEHMNIFTKVNFKKIEYGKLMNGTYWIKVTND